MNNENKINAADLENVTGGFVFDAKNISGSDPANPWEVIDNKNGNVLARFPSKQQAVAQAQSYGSNPYNGMDIDWDGVCKLRNNPIA